MQSPKTKLKRCVPSRNSFASLKTEELKQEMTKVSTDQTMETKGKKGFQSSQAMGMKGKIGYLQSSHKKHPKILKAYVRMLK